MKILVVDIGGTNVKLSVTGEQEMRKFRSRSKMTPKQFVHSIRQVIRDWEFDCVSIGYPGPVVRGKPIQNPPNLGAGWVGFDFEAAFGCPVKIMNDAAMQALGSYEGGRMLFIGLGTSVGSTLIVNRVVVPLELGHLPHPSGETFEKRLGKRGLKQLGLKKWQRSLKSILAPLKDAFMVDYIVVGGGNAKLLDEVPTEVRLGNNRQAFTGGCRLWEGPTWHGPSIVVGKKKPSVKRTSRLSIHRPGVVGRVRSA